MLEQTLIERGLSRREAEVGRCVAKGMTNKEVAELLCISEKTVKFHLTSIYKKLCMKNRTALAIWAQPLLQFEAVAVFCEQDDLPEGKK